METPDKSPFYEGHKIYTTLVATEASNPSSTRVMTVAYLYKTTEAPISGRPSMSTWKVVCSAAKTEELRNKIASEEMRKLTADSRGRVNQATSIKIKIGFAFIAGVQTDTDIKQRSDGRVQFNKTLKMFSEQNITAIFGNNNRVPVEGTKSDIITEVRDDKSPSSTIQMLIYNVFKDLIEKGNGVAKIINAIIDTSDEFKLYPLVEQLARADFYIYKNKSIEADEGLDDDDLAEESRERMKSRAAALLTGLGVLGDPPVENDSIRFEVQDGEVVHETAVVGALIALKQL